MNHQDHVRLLEPAGITGTGGLWADLGAGSGAFTLALRELVGPQAVIYAVDKNLAPLEELRRSYRKHFGSEQGLRLMPGDFSEPMELPPLDGLVMANSLHFFREKQAVLENLRGYLRPGGSLLVVEYNAERGNPWVPYPLSFMQLSELAARAGFTPLRLLAKAPSSFLREFYSAAAYRPATCA